MLAAALIVLTAAVYGHAQPFKAVRQLTSNNIIALAGNGDTLWMATERGFNYRTSANVESGWNGFEVNDMASKFWGLGFGGGGAVAIINKDGSIGFWHFNHGDGSQRQSFFKFSSSVHGDSATPVGSIVYSNGSFWAPFNHGGLVRFNPADYSVLAVRPEDVNGSLPQNLAGMDGNEAGAKAVLSLDVNRLDNSITVTAPKALWRYYPTDNRWVSIDTIPALVDTDGEFASFDAAFTVHTKDTATLYSFITTLRNGKNDATRLYASDGERWHIAINKARRYSVFPAVNGCVYALDTLESGFSAYRDTASTEQRGRSFVLMPHSEFRDTLRSAGYNLNASVNDILFLPKTDSSGTLAVATGVGLYVCESAEARSNRYDGFKLYNYVREVGSGEAYALPGVIRSGGEGRYEKCVFVYKLKNDGDVTIGVYDYNMSLVKTVVRGERRSADRSRSTVPDRDVWDGTNNRGKRAWPGVYYFKITSNAGERLFGKVILAK